MPGELTLVLSTETGNLCRFSLTEGSTGPLVEQTKADKWRGLTVWFGCDEALEAGRKALLYEVLGEILLVSRLERLLVESDSVDVVGQGAEVGPRPCESTCPPWYTTAAIVLALLLLLAMSGWIVVAGSSSREAALRLLGAIAGGVAALAIPRAGHPVWTQVLLSAGCPGKETFPAGSTVLQAVPPWLSGVGEVPVLVHWGSMVFALAFVGYAVSGSRPGRGSLTAFLSSMVVGLVLPMNLLWHGGAWVPVLGLSLAAAFVEVASSERDRRGIGKWSIGVTSLVGLVSFGWGLGGPVAALVSLGAGLVGHLPRIRDRWRPWVGLTVGATITALGAFYYRDAWRPWTEQNLSVAVTDAIFDGVPLPVVLLLAGLGLAALLMRAPKLASATMILGYVVLLATFAVRTPEIPREPSLLFVLLPASAALAAGGLSMIAKEVEERSVVQAFLVMIACVCLFHHAVQLAGRA